MLAYGKKRQKKMTSPDSTYNENIDHGKANGLARQRGTGAGGCMLAILSIPTIKRIVPGLPTATRDLSQSGRAAVICELTL